MLEYLLRLFLKFTNKGYLIQFIDGVQSIGKPTHVLYPSELLEQAILLGLSGLNNTLAVQSNQHWIWPYWVEKQLNPEADEFIPSGVNLLTTNLSSRNWTSLSIPGNRLEAMLDPVGMLTMEPFSWSVMPYLLYQDQYFIPSKMQSTQVTQSLHKKNWPEVITEYHTGTSLAWSSRCKAVEINKQQVILQKHTVKNLGASACDFIFGISLRPYNPLTIGHINKLSCKKNVWKVNGRPVLLMLDKPDIVNASNRLLGDPIYIDYASMIDDPEPGSQKIKLKSRSGISAGIAAYKIRLNAGEQICYQFLATDKQSSVFENRRKTGHWKKAIQQAETRFKQIWKLWSDRGIYISLPDQKIQNAFNAVKNHLCVFDDVDQFTPGSFFYHTGWFRDSAFLSLGFDQAGYFEQVKAKFPGYFKLQTLSGYFKSHNGEWDSTGQALFTIISHIRRSGDVEQLRRHYTALLKGGKWINKTRLTKIKTNLPHYGLLPAGLSAEHFGPNDYYYWDNFWSLTGLEQLIWSAEQLNKKDDVLWLQSIFDDYRQDLQRSINDVTTRTENKALPCSPYRWMDTAAIGNLTAVTPLNLIADEEYWVTPTLDFLWKNNVKKGLFFQHIIHSGYNIYLTIQLAKIFLFRQDPRWKIMFKAVVDAASPTWTWPEAIHPKTGGGCMGDGDHGWAAAEFISLVRDMFVFEKQQALYLGAGILGKWFGTLDTAHRSKHQSKKHRKYTDNSGLPDSRIAVRNASTLYGTVSYSIEKQDDVFILNWKISRNLLQAKVPAYFICPWLLKQYTVSKYCNVNSEKTRIQLTEDSGQCLFKPLRQ